VSFSAGTECVLEIPTLSVSAMAFSDVPRLKSVTSLRSIGSLGRLAARGPSPCPSLPWQPEHPFALYSERPSPTDGRAQLDKNTTISPSAPSAMRRSTFLQSEVAVTAGGNITLALPHCKRDTRLPDLFARKLALGKFVGVGDEFGVGTGAQFVQVEALALAFWCNPVFAD
jgi:hypothetical protein